MGGSGLRVLWLTYSNAQLSACMLLVRVFPCCLPTVRVSIVVHGSPFAEPWCCMCLFATQVDCDCLDLGSAGISLLYLLSRC